MAEKTWETVSRNPKEKLAILLASVACEQAAELVLNPTPASAGTGNTPELATSRQECIQAAISSPRIKKTEIRHAGVSGAEDRYAQVVSNYQPENCQSEHDVLHVERYKFTSQDPVHRSRFKNFLWGFQLLNRGITGGLRIAHLVSNGKDDKGLYQCSKGSKTTEARVEIEELAVDAQAKGPLSSRTLAKKVYKKTMQKISPKRC
jgi:hypothetical protein